MRVYITLKDKYRHTDMHDFYFAVHTNIPLF